MIKTLDKGRYKVNKEISTTPYQRESIVCSNYMMIKIEISIKQMQWSRRYIENDWYQRVRLRNKAHNHWLKPAIHIMKGHVIKVWFGFSNNLQKGGDIIWKWKDKQRLIKTCLLNEASIQKDLTLELWRYK